MLFTDPINDGAAVKLAVTPRYYFFILFFITVYGLRKDTPGFKYMEININWINRKYKNTVSILSKK